MATITASATGGNWSVGSTWVGGAAPGSGDDVLLAVSSGNITIDSNTNVCNSLNCTGYTGTLTHTAGINLTIGSSTAGLTSVALTLVSGMTYTLGSTTTSTLTFVSTSATQQTITFGGKVVAGLIFNGAGGSWQFESAMTLSASGSGLTLTAGSLDINGQTCINGYWTIGGSSTRSLSLGAANISLTPSAGNGWIVNGITGLTFNAGTSTITQNGGNQNFGGTSSGLTYNNVVFANGGSGGITVNGANTFANLTITLTSSGAIIAFVISLTQTITGTLTISGTNASNHSLISSSTQGTPATLNAAAVSLSNVDFMDITGAGTTWSGSSLGDLGGNSNITLTTPVTRYWVATSGGNWNVTTSWSTSSGGSSGATVPIPQDTAIFDSNSITSTGKTIVINNSAIPGLDFSNLTNSPIVNFNYTNDKPFINGIFKMISAMTITQTGSASWQLCGRGSYILQMAGNTFPTAINIAAPGGTYTSQDNLTISSSFNVNAGTYNTNYSVSCTSFTSSGSIVRSVIMGNGSWTLTSSGTIWNTQINTNLTLNDTNAILNCTDTSVTAKTLTFGSGDSLPNIIVPNGSSGTYIFNAGGTVTFAGMTFGAGTTHTFQSSRTFNFASVPILLGSSGNLVTINSSTSGTAAIFSCSAGLVNGNYVSVKDNTPTQVSTWSVGPQGTLVANFGNWLQNFILGINVTPSSAYTTNGVKIV